MIQAGKAKPRLGCERANIQISVVIRIMTITEWRTIEIADVKQLPVTRGCYAVLSGEEVLYIGRVKLLWTRLSNLNSHKTIKKIRSLLTDHLTIAYSVDDYDNEKALILQHTPRYNIDYLTKYG